jgi:hypothetical protein
MYRPVAFPPRVCQQESGDEVSACCVNVSAVRLQVKYRSSSLSSSVKSLECSNSGILHSTSVHPKRTILYKYHKIRKHHTLRSIHQSTRSSRLSVAGGVEAMDEVDPSVAASCAATTSCEVAPVKIGSGIAKPLRLRRAISVFAPSSTHVEKRALRPFGRKAASWWNSSCVERIPLKEFFQVLETCASR